jgi:hypothetical protein
MAITSINVSTPTGEIVFNDSAMGNTADAVKASSALVYSVVIDNSANAGAASYVKLFNLAAASVVVGTTAPDEIIYVPQGAVVTHVFFTGAAAGKTFGTALAAFCVTAGGTAGVTAPSSNTSVTINFK